MMIRGDKFTKLSEQEAMECSHGCEGGLARDIFLYTRNSVGATSHNSSPYKHENSKSCSKSVTDNPRVPGSVVNRTMDVQPNEDFIRYYLVQKGPLTCIIDMHLSFSSYASGIYTKNSDEVNESPQYHQVVFVGYGIDNGTKYWIVRNSWVCTILIILLIFILKLPFSLKLGHSLG